MREPLCSNGCEKLRSVFLKLWQMIRTHRKLQRNTRAAELSRSFAVIGKPASSVLSITVQKAYYQCQQALARSWLWDPGSHVEHDKLPGAGQMAQHFSLRHGQDFDGQAYDEALSE